MNQQAKIRVAVFKNNNKRSEQSPDFSGVVTFPDGREMEIALWNAIGKTNGMPYLNGHIGEKFKPQQQGGGNGGGYQPKPSAVAIDF